MATASLAMVRVTGLLKPTPPLSLILVCSLTKPTSTPSLPGLMTPMVCVNTATLQNQSPLSPNPAPTPAHRSRLMTTIPPLTASETPPSHQHDLSMCASLVTVCTGRCHQALTTTTNSPPTTAQSTRATPGLNAKSKTTPPCPPPKLVTEAGNSHTPSPMVSLLGQRSALKPSIPPMYRSLAVVEPDPASPPLPQPAQQAT